jgi:hypothetical protein
VRLLASVLCVLWASSASAATYYVRTDGSNANAGTSNTAGGAWLTIGFAVDSVTAGDTIRIQAGTYNEIPTPSDNGTSGSSITYVADGTVNVCGMELNGNSYLRFIGLVFNEGAGCADNNTGIVRLLGTNTGIEFWHNTVTNGVGNGITMTALADRCNQCIAVGNHFTALDHAADTVGGIHIKGNDPLIAYNEFDNIDADSIYGNWVNGRILNNYTHDIVCAGGAHADFFQTDAHDLGNQNILFEANIHAGQGNCSDEHVGVIQNLNSSQCVVTCGPYNEQLWRRNVWFNNSTALGISGATVATENRIRYIHNTEVDMMLNTPGTEYGSNFYNTVNFVYIFNNIAYENWATNVTTNIEVFHEEAATSDLGYNLAFDPNGSVSFTAAWLAQTGDQSNVNPDFVDKANRNFALVSTSAARNAAGPLTTTSGSGTGTTFNVATNGGGFFKGSNATNLPQYGGSLVPGDVITVGTDVLTVVAVTDDAIEVAETFTWANAESVYYGNDTTPDIGAYPFKSGGYSLSATYTASGGNLTVTPNDTSLVRWVVCFSDGVPVEVDNSSPYTCTTTGTPTVRVYPMFASTTLWATATSAAETAAQGSGKTRRRFKRR